MRLDVPTCKDCICYDVCNYHIDEETNMTVYECSHEFKHKDQYVKMPAYVGQPVWHIRTLQKYHHGDKKWETLGYEIEEGKVSMLQQKVDKSWKIRVSCDGSVSDYTPDKFDEYLFTTEAEAIKERDRRMKELTT